MAALATKLLGRGDKTELHGPRPFLPTETPPPPSKHFLIQFRQNAKMILPRTGGTCAPRGAATERDIQVCKSIEGACSFRHS